MKTLASALVALTLIAGPAAAYGPAISLPHLEFPTDKGTVSTQSCSAPVTEAGTCN
ncbi:hypothetical protein ACS3SW_10900 [Roseobacteraceae bacterium S113]